MSQRVVRELLDDLDGSPADETVTLAIDNKTFELDLSRDNAGELRDSLAKYLAVARRVHTTPRASRTNASSSNTAGRGKEQLAAAREWLRQQGHSIKDRGRIPARLLEVFDSAHDGRSAQHTPEPDAPQHTVSAGWH